MLCVSELLQLSDTEGNISDITMSDSEIRKIATTPKRRAFNPESTTYSGEFSATKAKRKYRSNIKNNSPENKKTTENVIGATKKSPSLVKRDKTEKPHHSPHKKTV